MIDIERLRALVQSWREIADKHDARAERLNESGDASDAAWCEAAAEHRSYCADELATLIAELGQEVGAVAIKRDRPAQEPGGVECQACGCIFIGEEWHSVCAVCLDKPGSERLCDFFADVGEVSRFMDELCNVVTELTGDEGEDDPITVLRRHIASSPAHTSEARDAARYRWLAENAIIQWPGVTHIGDDPASTRLPLDNAIDAAMRQEAGSRE